MILRKKKHQSATITNWDRCKAYFGNRCGYCSAYTKITKDHVLARHCGGSDMVFNIIPACQSCNSSKGKKDMISWYRKQSFYSLGRESRIRFYLTNQYINYYNHV